MPPEAINLNVEGRGVSGPLQGFGPLWQKTYQVRLSGVKQTPTEVMQVWKENFAKFQPPGNHFYSSLEGIKPGEIMLLDSKVPVFPGTPGAIPVATGMMVLYVDDTSITLMTPEGHPESGWNTFSVFEEDGVSIAQVQSFGRSADPIYEFGYKLLGGEHLQEQTWSYVLLALAAYYGILGQVSMYKTCLDPKYQWKEARQVWKNASVRTIFYYLGAPLRWIRRLFSPGKPAR